LLTPLISYDSPEALKKAIQDSDLSYSFDETLFDDLVGRGLPPLVSPTVFALILGVSPKLLTSMARNPTRYYRMFPIEKRGGGQRTISAPRTFLKAVQYYILRFILQKQPVSDFATGFVRGKGIVHNARLHAGRPFLLNVDLRDFFGSVRSRHVREEFLKIGFPMTVADSLAQLCTFGGSLPQGAPTSPALSNLVFAGIDQRIATLASVRGIGYSRYADDMTFSSLRPIARHFVGELDQTLQEGGFRLNPEKTRFTGPGQARYVTGLVVNVRPQVDRQTRRRIRAMFHQVSINPDRFTERANELLGWASYVRSFDFIRGQRYIAIAKSIPR
jgi:RNA-directed DNA polymerase